MNLRLPVQLHGDRYAMMSLLDRSLAERGLLRGFLTTFTVIKFDGPWFDAGTLRKADDEVISEVVLPDNVFPNAATFRFVMDVNKHRIYIQSYSSGRGLSPAMARMYFERAGDNISLTQLFGQPKITVVQNKAALDSVFDLKVVKRVIIELEKPNADIFDDDLDEQIERYLEEHKSRRITVVLEAERGESIPRTPQLNRVGESALENGSVTTEGRDELGAARRSTEDIPMELHDKYDPDQESEDSAFLRLVGAV
jgi:hypothetical protein